MLCQKCKQKEANTHIVRTVGNNTVELYLCSECAQESGVTADFDISNFLFSDMLSSPLLSFDKAVCPVCRTSFAQIQRSGNVGCGECYKSFEKELQSTISRLHSLPFHKGKIPKLHKKSEEKEKSADKKPSKLTKEQTIEKLKAEQDEAIRAENFEKAAELRDKIRNLEKGKDEQ